MAVVSMAFEAGDADSLPCLVKPRDKVVETLNDLAKLAEVPAVPVKTLFMRIGVRSKPFWVASELGVHVLDPVR